MKRYLVFEFDAYYPGGGTEDLTLRTDDLNEAFAKVRASRRDYQEVFDNEIGELLLFK